MNTKLTISLVIPAYNEGKYIGSCLDSAIKNSQGKFLEIIVIDNASTDNTGEIASAFPGVRVVREDKKGLTQARERGLKEAKGDLIAYIDADTQLPKQWAETVEKVFSQKKNIVSLSGPYKYYDGTVTQRYIMNCLWWISAPISYRLVGYMILGGNFVAKKEALIAIGGFDTSIEFYGEDTNIARRLSTQGKTVFLMNFFIYTSLRRIAAEGIFKTNIIYMLNFVSEAFFGKPFTKTHKDIRIDTNKK